MHRKYVKEVYDDYILTKVGVKCYFKDNFVYKKIDNYGNVYHFNESGQSHCLDGPTVEYINGGKSYYINGDRYSYEDWLEKVKEYE